MPLDTMNVANVICRFGEKVLLDYAREIVLPAFFDDTLIRHYKGSDYFFYNVKYVELEEGSAPVLGIAGQLVRNTILEREQIFDGATLIPDREYIESSPSSFFCFILNNHKLLFSAETSHAPSMNAFGATLGNFLKRKHAAYIEELAEQTGEPVARIKRMHQRPKVLVLPLASRESVKEFVHRFRKLQKVEIALLDTNDESHSREAFLALREMRTDIGAAKTALVHVQKEGLDHAHAISQIADAGETGNAVVSLRGLDADGNRLIGNNENFKISVPVSALPEDNEERGRHLYNVFSAAVEKGRIVIDKIIDRQKVEAAIRKLLDD